MSGITEIISSLVILTILEVVLGIDNIVYLAIVSQKLPQRQQKSARRIGLTIAWVMRLLLLASALWLTKLVTPLFYIFNNPFSGRDLFLLIGGSFLLFKATQEIHTALERKPKKPSSKKSISRFSWVITQIALLDIVFSLDSILAAIGLTRRFWLMAIAITFAILTMIFASEPLSAFIERHVTIKMLALSYLLLIGMSLVADGLGFHIPRGYLYFAMGFSLLVEFLNLLQRKRRRRIR